MRSTPPAASLSSSYQTSCPSRPPHQAILWTVEQIHVYTVGVMEKFPFCLDTVPFCLLTVFHFIRFLTFFRFTVLFPFSFRAVCVLFTLTSGKLITAVQLHKRVVSTRGVAKFIQRYAASGTIARHPVTGRLYFQVKKTFPRATHPLYCAAALYCTACTTYTVSTARVGLLS